MEMSTIDLFKCSLKNSDNSKLEITLRIVLSGFKRTLGFTRNGNTVLN